MGIKIQGPVCVSCNTLIEDQNFFVCSRCGVTVHNNDYCRKIHMSSCRFGNQNGRINPDKGRMPDVRDIFK